MAINLQQLMALLQQQPAQGAVMPPGGDPPPAAAKPSAPKVPQDLLRRGYTPMEGADPADLQNAIQGAQAFHANEPKPPEKNFMQKLFMLEPEKTKSIKIPNTVGTGSFVPGAKTTPGPGIQPGIEQLLRDVGHPEFQKPDSGMSPMEGPKQDEVVVQGRGGSPSLFERLDEERGYNAQQKALMGAQGTGPIASMFTDAASEVMQRGADTPDKADDVLRNEFQDDPEIESAISEARARYLAAQARSAKPPGVMEYVGYVLATLAGANPMQAAEAISRRGEKRQDEQLALKDLLSAQGMKIKDRQQQRELGAEQGAASDKLLFQQQKEGQRQSERAETQSFNRLKSGRGAALQELNQLRQQMQYSNNPAEKKALQQQIDLLQRRKQFFNRQLGEPEQDEQGRPMGMVSPDAMRLLGLG